MKPTSARNYQTAGQALKVILKANKSGQSVKIDDHGDVVKANPPSVNDLAKTPSSLNPLKNFFLFFRPKPKPTSAQSTQQPPEVIWTVINKMKIELGIAATELKSQSSLCIPSPSRILDKYLPNAVNFQTKGHISELDAQWLAIQTDIKGAKDGIQSSMNRLETSHYSKVSSQNKQIKNLSEEIKKSEEIPTNLTKNPQIAEANLCLPAYMPKISRTGEVVKGTLTIPPEEQLSLFDQWHAWDTHGNVEGKASGDPFISLSKAFQLDANRMTYVFESKGIAVECDRDKESVAIGFKQTAGKNPMRQLILSHLIGQESVKRMFEKIQRANPSANEESTIFLGTGIPGDSQTKIHMTAHDNGDIEIDYLYLAKCQVISTTEIKVDINRSKKFDGLLSQENATTCMKMKIRIRNEDLNRGELKFTVIEPLKLNVQVELPNNPNDQ